MRTVPFFQPSIDEDDIQAVANSLRSGWLTRGAQCEAFEHAFAEYVGARHAVSVNGCSTALVAALAALGIGAGDLVVVPALTFIATASAVLAVGATPLLVDCSPDSLSIDFDAGRAALGNAAGGLKPAAVVPVHFGGRMVNVAQLIGFADEFNLEIVHDAAHCVPSAWRASTSDPWRRIGELPGVACFSFYANKTITTGEGGMLTTDDASLATLVRRLTAHGVEPALPNEGHWNYEVPEFGLRGTLTDPLAALGLSQLRRADLLWERRRSVARRYIDRLGTELPCDLPLDDHNVQNAWHIFPIRLRLDRLTCGRDDVLRSLSAAGVSCSVHYRPLHHHNAVARGLRAGRILAGSLDQVDTFWPAILSLPIYPDLTADAQDQVCTALEQFLASAVR